jgi:hypothetical protein
MNCLEFHRQKLAAPRESSPEGQAHIAQCAACREFARGVDEAERVLERTLAVPVPDGLADRILLHARAARRPWRGWALAASVLLAVAAALAVLFYRPPAGEQYAREAIAHVVAEPESFTKVNAADGRVLEELVREAGGKLMAPLGPVRYVKLCPMENGGTGLHLVFETPQGLATLLIVPGQRLAGLERASSADWNALARPAARGYYAVVTASPQATAQVDRMVRERIDWGA